MIHIQNAKDSMPTKCQDFINVGDNNVLTINIQDGTIPMAGVNGIQAMDLILYTKELINSLNISFPCKENRDTIELLEQAYHAQELRTINREKKGIEGTLA